MNTQTYTGPSPCASVLSENPYFLVFRPENIGEDALELSLTLPPCVYFLFGAPWLSTALPL